MPQVADRLRFRGAIANNVVRAPSYRGRPTTEQQHFELDEATVGALEPQMPGLPLCYNHHDHQRVGVVTASHREGRRWLIDGEVHDPEAIKWVREGGMDGLSLKHRRGDNKALEVSICWKGARPDTRLRLYRDSNSGRYTSGDDGCVGTEIAASSDSTEDLTFLTFHDLTFEVVVVAASAATPMDPLAQQPSQPPAPVAQQQQAAPPPPPVASPAEPLTAEKIAQDFPVSTQVAKLFAGGAHGNGGGSNILTKESQRALHDTVSRLEVEKLEAVAELKRKEELLKQQEEQLRKHQEELERAKQEAAKQALVNYETEKKVALARQTIGDFAKTYGGQLDPRDDAEIGNVMASLTPTQAEFLATRVAAAMQQHQRQPETAPPQDTATMDFEMNDRMLSYYQRYPPASTVLASASSSSTVQSLHHQPQQQLHDDVAKPAAAAQARYHPYRRPTEHGNSNNTVAASFKSRDQTMAESIGLSVDTNYKWGTPIESRPTHIHSAMADTVAASFGGGRYSHHRPTREAPKPDVPGSGCNFDFSFMTPAQIGVHMYTPVNAGNNIRCIDHFSSHVLAAAAKERASKRLLSGGGGGSTNGADIGMAHATRAQHALPC